MLEGETRHRVASLATAKRDKCGTWASRIQPPKSASHVCCSCWLRFDCSKCHNPRNFSALVNQPCSPIGGTAASADRRTAISPCAPLIGGWGSPGSHGIVSDVADSGINTLRYQENSVKS